MRVAILLILLVALLTVGADARRHHRKPKPAPKPTPSPPPGPTCGTATCSAGEVCLLGSCTDLCLNVNCSGGQRCDPAIGQCVSCNPFCPSGQVCTSQGKCVAAGQCMFQEDCDTGYQCLTINNGPSNCYQTCHNAHGRTEYCESPKTCQTNGCA